MILKQAYDGDTVIKWHKQYVLENNTNDNQPFKYFDYTYNSVFGLVTAYLSTYMGSISVISDAQFITGLETRSSYRYSSATDWVQSIFPNIWILEVD